MEYLEDYQFTLHYHSGKANPVSDALSRKSYASASTLSVCTWEMLNTLKNFALFVNRKEDRAFVFNVTVCPTLIQ